MGYDFKELRNHSHNYPEKDVLIETSIEQLENGADPEQVLKEALEFASNQADVYSLLLIKRDQEAAADAIKNLSMAGDWGSLSSIAEHALQEAEGAASKTDGAYMQMVLEGIKLRRKMMGLGTAELRSLIDQP